MLPDVDLDAPGIKPCAAVDDPATSDLTWLMHRAERVLSRDFDAACRAVGLKDLRDTLVLAVAGDGIARTQIEIASTLGLDKTTLSAIIDRLERQGFLERGEDPANRRTKIPVTTAAGRDALEHAVAKRDELIADTMARLGDEGTAELRVLLWKVATAR
ncbi:MarR family transcriptional regulator [Microbacterium sp. X-17]|uniref:MarR family winged helix-turn-helix transcriptional regulator n=1 Tax=Microbacterium sp. X-17 TaxID=3144404 RepID=UPI0031F4F6FB